MPVPLPKMILMNGKIALLVYSLVVLVLLKAQSYSPVTNLQSKYLGTNRKPERWLRMKKRPQHLRPVPMKTGETNSRSKFNYEN